MPNSIGSGILVCREIEEEYSRFHHSSLQYPVLSLPTEIVVEIFVAYLPAYPTPPNLLGLDSPLNLTRICRLWREIAHTTPTLWRAIRLQAPRHKVTQALRGDFEMLSIVLSRSGSCLLSIHLAGNPSVWIAGVIAAILPYRSRWEYLSLDIDASVVSSIAGPIPQLVGLQISSWDYPPTHIMELEATKMRSLCIWDIDCSSTLPWSQLTTLSLRDAGFGQCVEILLQGVNLIYLRVWIDDDDAEDLPELEHNQLQTLILHNFSDEENLIDPPRPFLRTFALPALRVLQVDELNDIELFQTFLTRSRCSLKQLRLRDQGKGLPLENHPSIQQVLYVGADGDKALLPDALPELGWTM